MTGEHGGGGGLNEAVEDRVVEGFVFVIIGHPAARDIVSLPVAGKELEGCEGQESDEWDISVLPIIAVRLRQVAAVLGVQRPVV